MTMTAEQSWRPTNTVVTAGVLRAIPDHVPDEAPVLLIVHSDHPTAGWLGFIRYDPDTCTLDLHDCRVTETPGSGFPLQMGPS